MESESEGLACPPRTDPDVVLDLKANQHKGESYGQKDKLPGTNRKEAASSRGFNQSRKYYQPSQPSARHNRTDIL
jgi:hypothetical protein